MDNVWILLIAVVEVTNILMCYTQILQAELTEKRRSIFCMYAGIIFCNVINICCGRYIDYTFLNIMYCFVAIGFVMKEKILKWILLYPCAYLTESIACVAVSYIYAILTNKSQSVLSDNGFLSVLINSMFWILMLIKKVYNQKRGKDAEKIKFENSLYVALTFGSVSFLLMLSAVQYSGDKFCIPYSQTNLFGLLLSCVCIIFFIMFFWLATTIHKNELYQREKDMMCLYMSEQERYIKLVIEKDNDMRSFRHDVKEHMWVISQCIERSEYEEAKRYIDEMYKKFNDSQMERYTGIVAVDAIVSEKKKCMEEKGIKLVWDGSACKLPSRLEPFDICTLFANIMNNAIEACEELGRDDKKIIIKVTVDDGRVYIAERNKTINNICFDEMGNPITSKADKKRHGYGSKNVRSVVEKYNGELLYSVEEKCFCVEIVI